MGRGRVDCLKGLGIPVAWGERKEEDITPPPPGLGEVEEEGTSGREERREAPKVEEGLKG